MKPEAPRLNRPPFATVATLGPAQVGAEIVATFVSLGRRADRLEFAHTQAWRSIGLPADDPLGRAGRAIARDIDQGIGAGVAQGYHNPQHFLEVMLCALYLARLAGFDARRTARVVSAGLMHDFHHDGSRSTSSPFRLELLAAQRSMDYLREAKVDADERSRIETLVLATEPRAGVPFARACWAQHRDAGAAVAMAAALPPALERLTAHAELAQEAVLLAEADVLPSIGLTFEHAEQLQARLAAEWGTVLGRADKLQFIERMIGDISVAAFFVPNIQALRQAYLRVA